MSKGKSPLASTDPQKSLTSVLSQRFTPETITKDLDRLRTISYKGRPYPETQLATVTLLLKLQGYLKDAPSVDARSVNLTLSNLDPAQLTQMVNTLKDLSARFHAITVPYTHAPATRP